MSEETSEEKLKRLNAERKELKKSILDGREARLQKAADDRVVRDKQIEKIQEVLGRVQAVIYEYNKLGKTEKAKFNILSKIKDELNLSKDEFL